MFFSKFFSPFLENFQAKSLSFPPSLMIGQHTQKKKKCNARFNKEKIT
jgi:hypothetical protein